MGSRTLNTRLKCRAGWRDQSRRLALLDHERPQSDHAIHCHSDGGAGADLDDAVAAAILAWLSGLGLLEGDAFIEVDDRDLDSDLGHVDYAIRSE